MQSFTEFNNFYLRLEMIQCLCFSVCTNSYLCKVFVCLKSQQRHKNTHDKWDKINVGYLICVFVCNRVYAHCGQGSCLLWSLLLDSALKDEK